MQAYRNSLAPKKQNMITKFASLGTEINYAYDELFEIVETALTQPRSFGPRGPMTPKINQLARRAELEGLDKDFGKVWIECEKIMKHETLGVGIRFLPTLIVDTLNEITQAKTDMLAKYPENQRVQSDVPLLFYAVENGFRKFTEQQISNNC
jgi:hypothetical protein